jgi:Tfp pilus assembly protein PilF
MDAQVCNVSDDRSSQDRASRRALPTVVALLIAVAVLSSCASDEKPVLLESRIASLMDHGVALAQQAQIDSARLLFERVLGIDSTSPAAHYRLGMLYEFEGRPTEAEESYRRALRHDSTSDAAHLNLGQLLGKTGRYEDAMVHFDAALRHSSDSSLTGLAHYCLGMAHGIMGDTEASAESYRRATTVDSTFARAFVGRGQELLRQGNAAEALPALLRALELDPTLADAYGHLGTAYRMLGRLEEAEAVEATRQAVRRARIEAQALRRN